MANNTELVWIPIGDLPGKMLSAWTRYRDCGSSRLYQDIVRALCSGLVAIRGKRSLRISFERIEQLIDEQSIDDLSIHIGQVSLPGKKSFLTGIGSPVGPSMPRRIEYTAVEVDWITLKRYVKSNFLPAAIQKVACNGTSLMPKEGEASKSRSINDVRSQIL